MIRRAIKVRLYPSDEQQSILAKHFGCSKAIYNMGLRKCIWHYYEALETGEGKKSLSYFDLSAWLTEFKQDPSVCWLAEVPRNILDQSLQNLSVAYKNFFKGHKIRGTGFPKFKGRYARRVAKYSRGIKVDDSGRKASIPGVGWLPIKGWRNEFSGYPIKTSTVELSEGGRYSLSMLVEIGVDDPKAIETIETVTGMDLGIADLVTLDDGTKFPNPKHLIAASDNLKRKDRSLSRKAKGSNQRKRAKLQRARAQEKVKNMRNDYANKVAHHIASNSDAVACEDLAIKNMMKNKSLSKAIGDAGWGMLVEKIAKKMESKGGLLVKVNRFFPSSKTCSSCGHVVKSVPLSIRNWACVVCGAEHDRDVNAAQNIRKEGLKKLLADGRSVTATGG